MQHRTLFEYISYNVGGTQNHEHVLLLLIVVVQSDHRTLHVQSIAVVFNQNHTKNRVYVFLHNFVFEWTVFAQLILS